MVWSILVSMAENFVGEMDMQETEHNSQASGTSKSFLPHHIMLLYWNAFREMQDHIDWLKHEFFKNYLACGSEAEDRH